MRTYEFPVGCGWYAYCLWEAPVEDGYICYLGKVIEITITDRKNQEPSVSYLVESVDYGRRRRFDGEDFGRMIFVTEEEAKEGLKNLKERDKWID